METIKQNLGTLKEYFTQKGALVRCADPSDLIVNYKINNCYREAVVRVSDEAVDVQVYCVRETPENPAIKEALEENHPELTDYLNKVNQILKEGTFEVEQGRSVSYRLSLPITEKVQASDVWEAYIAGNTMREWIWTELLNIMNGCGADEMFLQTMIGIVKEAKQWRGEYVTSEVVQIIEENIIPEIERTIIECIGG